MNVIPVIVRALGAVTNLEEELKRIEIMKKELDRVQFCDLLGSARIVRIVFHIPGSGLEPGTSDLRKINNNYYKIIEI